MIDAFQMNGWASHLPALLACVTHTTGQVLELGMGSYSTPILHAVCRSRRLVSIEGGMEWMNRFADFASPSHQLVCAAELGSFATEPWDVVLVDSAPGGTRTRETKTAPAR